MGSVSKFAPKVPSDIHALKKKLLVLKFQASANFHLTCYQIHKVIDTFLIVKRLITSVCKKIDNNGLTPYC